MQVEIKDKIITNIKEYCLLNNIEDWVEVLNNLLYKGLMVSKYGRSPHENKIIEHQGTQDFNSNIKIYETDVRPVKEEEKVRTPNVIQDREEKKDMLSQEEAKSHLEIAQPSEKKRIIKRTIKKKKNE